MSDTYREDLQSLDSAMYEFINAYSDGFTKEELETFRQAYAFIMMRQDKVAEEIRKEWRK